MKEKADLLVSEAAELVTANGPTEGSTEEALGLVRDGAVAVLGGRVKHTHVMVLSGTRLIRCRG